MNTEATPAPKEVIAAARVLAKRHAEACNVNADDVWTFHSEDFIADATAALQGAGYLAASGAPQEAPGDAPQLWKVEHDLYTPHVDEKPAKLKVQCIVLAKDSKEAEKMGADLATLQVFGPRIVSLLFRSVSSQGESFVIPDAAMKGPQ